MIFLKTLCLSSCLLFLSACAFLHSLDENLPQQIESWIKSEDYGSALDTLDYIDRQHKDYALLMRQKNKILKLVPVLEDRILKQGKKLLKQEKWHEAQQSYEYGLDKLPDSRPIQKAYGYFLAKRAAHLQQLKLKLLQNKTKWLLDDVHIREEMTAVVPRNYRARWMLQDHQADIDSTTQTLVECVNHSISDGELDVGKQCLNIAKQLTPSEKIAKRLATLEKNLDKEITARSRHLTEMGKKSLRLARQALAQGDYTRVKRLVDALPARDKKNAQVLAFRKKMDIQLADYLANRIREGRRLYSTGEIQQAYLMWKSIQPLAPNNKKLEQLIKRSQHILNKLRKIENNPQQTITPPGASIQ